MGLREYQRKRDFTVSPEPRGRAKASGRAAAKAAATARQFVVQKHAASRLHYDFRLEDEGVLLSWAVPKGPSLDPADKRLAVEVEDHPIEYGSFEGIIPKGEYGGGTVLLWDRGTWEPEGSVREGLRKGRLDFTLRGEKLAGGWRLVRTAGRGDGRSEKPTWLLMKRNDEAARQGAAADVTGKRPESVATGREIEAIASAADRVWSSRRGEVAVDAPAAPPSVDPSAIAGARRGRLAATLRPQLATLVDAAPQGDEWLHEIKLDGYRTLGRLGGAAKVRLLTRNGKDWTSAFARVAAAVKSLPVDEAVLDGEVVALEPDGRSSFQALQRALGRGGDPAALVYYVFDLLFLDGVDLRGAALERRKELLARLLAPLPRDGVVRYSDHVFGGGEEFFQHACRLAVEGTIAKRRAAPYTAGRNKDWLKVKCLQRQELVIGGYTDPAGARSGFGALLVGYHENGALRFAGKVGTGFDAATLRDLHARLRRLERETPPFANPPRGAAARGAHWVTPELVAEVQFTEWTADGALRHPSFRGLRADKKAAEVTREQPLTVEVAEDEAPEKEAAPPRRKAAPARRKTAASRAAAAPETPVRPSRQAPPAYRPGGAASERRSARTRRGEGETELAGVRLTNPDRVLYPDHGLTKLDLAAYYLDVAEHMLPHAANRALTLVRCPQGYRKHCFYQKHVAETLPPSIGTVDVREESGETKPYLVLQRAAGLVALVQLGVLEIHLWGSRIDRLERPDRLVFDLDPDVDLPWRRVAAAAVRVKERLAELGLESWLKTTGGKGLHVVVPIDRRSEWEEAKEFARALVRGLEHESPEQFVTSAAKAKRQGKIFLDYLRNARGATAIAPYSTRARSGAPVAVPLAWDELAARPLAVFDITSTRRRLAAIKVDPWKKLATTRQAITRAARRQLGLR